LPGALHRDRRASPAALRVADAEPRRSRPSARRRPPLRRRTVLVDAGLSLSAGCRRRPLLLYLDGLGPPPRTLRLGRCADTLGPRWRGHRRCQWPLHPLSRDGAARTEKGAGAFGTRLIT